MTLYRIYVTDVHVHILFHISVQIKYYIPNCAPLYEMQAGDLHLGLGSLLRPADITLFVAAKIELSIHVLPFLNVLSPQTVLEWLMHKAI